MEFFFARCPGKGRKKGERTIKILFFSEEFCTNMALVRTYGKEEGGEEGNWIKACLLALVAGEEEERRRRKNMSNNCVIMPNVLE